jgi:hypothetical protein
MVIGFLGSEYVDTEKIKGYLGLEDSKFVGNAVQYTGGGFPQARMSCTVLDGKTENIDLEGKILIIPKGGDTDSHKKTYEIIADECYIIRDGKPIRIVPLSVTGGINQALEGIHLLNDTTYTIGLCGKSDPVYSTKEDVPVSEFTRSQLWAEQQLYPTPISPEHLKVLIK